MVVSLGLALLASAAGAAAPTITEYHGGITAGSHPAGIAAGPDGSLWFTEYLAAQVAKITPSVIVTEYSAGVTGHALNAITAGPDRNLWFTEYVPAQVAKITPAGAVTEYRAKVAVSVTVKGKGRVTGRGISCPSRCKTTIASGAQLTLRARAARGYRFAGWSGACASALTSCTLWPRGAAKITATFGKRHS